MHDRRFAAERTSASTDTLQFRPFRDTAVRTSRSVILEHALRLGAAVVFFDDCIGSGGQVETIVENWLGTEAKLKEDHGPPLSDDLKRKLRESELSFIFLTGPASARDKVAEVCKKLELRLGEVHVIRPWPENGLVSAGFDRNSPLWAYLAKVGEDLLRTTKSQWAEEKFSERCLGYGNSAQLLVFPTNVPTQTVTAIWSEGRTQNRTWIPLVPRRPKRDKDFSRFT